MIDQFCIFTPSGLVLFKYQLRRIPADILNTFISNVFISEREALVGINNQEDSDSEDRDEGDVEEKAGANIKTHNVKGFSIKYLRKNDLIFTLIHDSIIYLNNSQQFLSTISSLFIEMFGDEILENLKNNSFELIDPNEDNFIKFEKFFEIKLNEFQSDNNNNTNTNNEQLQKESHEESRNIIASPGSPKSLAKKNIKKSNKKGRKWGADGTIIDDYGDVDNDVNLDFSSKADTNSSSLKNDDVNLKLQQAVGDKAHFGSKTRTGEFLVSDLSEEMDNILKNSSKKNSGLSNSSSNTTTSSQPFGFLRNYIGGKKITKEDVNKTTQLLINHLIKKNVAPEVAKNLVSNVEKNLVGSTTKNFTSVETTAKKSLEGALTKLLTPNSSIDLLNEIQAKKKSGNLPYVISVVGVNGVGKSTNLSKLAFWLLQNNYRVLITACDTFRSGAVEQLRVHVDNLKNLTNNNDDNQMVDLFQEGYGGADLVSKIAKGAIKYAMENNFDIVLMDTAGRRHNDSKLMAPLQNFVKAAKPDKIIMVGEALVGTDSVLQAKNFNNAFGPNKNLDFFIISKCDTVGDLIGSMVNMVYATGIPILFVGTGQTYTDLRTLSVEWAVNMLMS
ncbi:hypothetical protein PACTADRAFT_29568, partial [Pachysolen tannophilus NRRL Y-2460]